MRKFGVLAASLGMLVFAPAAQAEVQSVFGGDAPCQVKADGIRVCEGITETWDGTTPIDVNVILPPEGQGDGPFPAIGWFHGWGGHKQGVDGDGNAEDRARDWALRGYAVFSMSDRGWGDSCGGQDSKRLTPACADGYNHLMDTRYEVRDAQFLFGRLADQNIVIPDRIGAVGPSYGGGISMALAALRNRVMMPDDTLVPWTSPNGKPMAIAVATPEIPWTDLAYSLMPNGRTLDYVADSPYLGPDGDWPIGVLKQSFVAGLYAVGLAGSNYAPPGTDPDADLTRWFALVNAGEPYDENPESRDVVDEITTHHSSYYIPTATGYGAEGGQTAPAPLLISNGWTDDLFPPDEAIRFYNRTRAQFPGNDISLYFLDYGHQRGQNKEGEVAKLEAAEEAWLDHYLKGSGPRPEQGVTAISQSCDEEAYGAPRVGPFSAPTWDDLSPGEVRLVDQGSKTIAPAGGSPEDGRAFDPITGGGACARTDGSDKPGTATYRMKPAKGNGFTLAGSPTVIADITSPGPHSQIAARLLDVAPDGEQTLVGRALYRPDPSGRQVFQLHPNAYRFQHGHVAKLELLPNDSPYGRPTNGQAPVTVANLELRLPVRERPRGSGSGAVTEPRPSIVPQGSRPAPGTQAAGLCETGLSEKGTRRGDRIKGTSGGDRLRGRKGNERISGGDGDDCISGGKGKDRMRGGEGHDTIRAKDGKRDRVACGPGQDKAAVDRKDQARGCERETGRASA